MSNNKNIEGIQNIQQQIQQNEQQNSQKKQQSGITQLKNFEVIRKLGQGSYSSVYKVKRIADQKIYGMKKIKMHKLNKKEQQNSLNEVRFLASLNHKNIIKYYESFFDEETQCLFMVMEYLDGGDLFQHINYLRRKNQYMDEQVIWIYLIQLIQGLKALHQANICHRDIKSANIFLSKDGITSKIGDLNVSKLTRQGMCHTQTGTPYYASPEVWKDKPYDLKSDVWSLGCIAYEMCMHKTPFRAQGMDNLFKQVQKGTHDLIADHYSQELCNIIEEMLIINPQKRPSTFDLLQKDVIQKRIKFLEEAKVLLSQDSKFQSTYDTANTQANTADEEQFLMKTIYMPNQFSDLHKILPEANYEDNQNKEKIIKNQQMLQQNSGSQSYSQNKINMNNESQNQNMITTTTTNPKITNSTCNNSNNTSLNKNKLQGVKLRRQNSGKLLTNTNSNQEKQQIISKQQRCASMSEVRPSSANRNKLKKDSSQQIQLQIFKKPQDSNNHEINPSQKIKTCGNDNYSLDQSQNQVINNSVIIYNNNNVINNNRNNGIIIPQQMQAQQKRQKLAQSIRKGSQSQNNNYSNNNNQTFDVKQLQQQKQISINNLNNNKINQNNHSPKQNYNQLQSQHQNQIPYGIQNKHIKIKSQSTHKSYNIDNSQYLPQFSLSNNSVQQANIQNSNTNSLSINNINSNNINNQHILSNNKLLQNSSKNRRSLSQQPEMQSKQLKSLRGLPQIQSKNKQQIQNVYIGQSINKSINKSQMGINSHNTSQVQLKQHKKSRSQNAKNLQNIIQKQQSLQPQQQYQINKNYQSGNNSNRKNNLYTIDNSISNNKSNNSNNHVQMQNKQNQKQYSILGIDMPQIKLKNNYRSNLVINKTEIGQNINRNNYHDINNKSNLPDLKNN